ncbi:MAG TPA: hypothetical protein VFA33_26850 [Bryobacteraceae bacterium]|nr:hypothetical protein [Bryobacteraceae bacterium]
MKKLWLLPCLAMVLTAADISGKWIGSIEVADDSSGTTINTPVRAEFEQKSNLLSGKIGRREDQQTESIRNGKVEGTKIVFEVTSPETAGAMKFDLTLEGDRIEGNMKGSLDSGPITGKVHLVRQAASTTPQP